MYISFLLRKGFRIKMFPIFQIEKHLSHFAPDSMMRTSSCLPPWSPSVAAVLSWGQEFPIILPRTKLTFDKMTCLCVPRKKNSMCWRMLSIARWARVTSRPEVLKAHQAPRVQAVQRNRQKAFGFCSNGSKSMRSSMTSHHAPLTRMIYLFNQNDCGRHWQTRQWRRTQPIRTSWNTQHVWHCDVTLEINQAFIIFKTTTRPSLRTLE